MAGDISFFPMPIFNAKDAKDAKSAKFAKVFDRINMIYKILRGFEHRQNMVRKDDVHGV